MGARLRQAALVLSAALHLAIALAMIWFLRKLSDVQLHIGSNERCTVTCVLNAASISDDMDCGGSEGNAELGADPYA